MSNDPLRLNSGATPQVDSAALIERIERAREAAGAVAAQPLHPTIGPDQAVLSASTQRMLDDLATGRGPANVASGARQTGCTELPASAKGLRRSDRQFQNPVLRGLDPDWSQTSTATVAALRKALDAAQ